MTTPIFLNVLVNTIIKDYFQNARCIFIFSESSRTFEYKGNLTVVNINVINQTIDEDIVFQSYGCQEIIIHHQNSPRILTEIEEKIKLHTDRFNFRKYLIIPNLQPSENLTQIFDLPEMEYIVDMLVVIPIKEPNPSIICESKFKILCNHNEIFKLMTHKYVGENNNQKPEVLDLWFSKNESFLYGNNLYPDKISNQQGRPLKCATFTYKPYSIIEESPTVSGGSENSATYEYVKRLNMTLKYITDDDEWGIIYDNWTGNGILGNLATGKADIGYAALYSWEHEFGFLDFSKSTVRTGITCLVPAPQLAGGWLTPLFPFSSEMWIGTGISFIAAYLVSLILTIIISKQHLQGECKGDELRRNKNLDYKGIFKDTFSSMVRIFLIQSVESKREALNEALRYMFVIFLFSLLLTSSYSSGLASVMTIPRYENSIDTVFDLANSDLHWGATQDAWIFSILAEERPQYITLVKKFLATTPENLIEYAKANHFAFSIERLPSGQYAIGSYVSEEIVKKLRLMHEDFYWEYCIFMLRKSSPLLNSLDTFLLHASEAGLIYFWEMRAAETHMDLRVQNIVKYYATSNEEKQDDIVKLKFMHVEGAFGILIIGYAVASVCFIIELLVHRFKYEKPKFIL